MFLKPNQKKIISTIVILISIFAAKSINKPVQEQFIVSNPPLQSLENINLEIDQLVENFKNLTPEQEKVLKEITGEKLWNLTNNMIDEVIDEPGIFTINILKLFTLSFLITSIIYTAAIYTGVSYILTEKF